MVGQFIKVQGDRFTLDGKPVTLRGWALGSWMNFEHFMMGMPGTNSMIIEAFERVYGTRHAEEFVENLQKSMVSKEDIHYMKSLGANTVRIPFGYHYFMDDLNPGVFLEHGFEILDRVVRMCAEEGMYVVLDLHSVPGSQNTDWHSDNITGQPLFWRYKCFQDQIIWLWRELASRYAANPWVIGYDVLNEPGYGLSPDQINSFYARAGEAIRSVDKNHILFLEGIDFGRDFSPLADMDDPLVAYTVHFYPFVLEEDVLSPEMDNSHRKEVFAKIFDRQLGEVSRFGKPIWCGESGYEILQGMEEFYGTLLLDNIGMYEERGISWNLWTYKDAGRMGIVVPRNDSPWMKLRSEIAKMWSHEREQKISMEVTRAIGDRYYKPLSDSLAYDLDFRIRSVLHRIAVEQVLIPTLESIPWESMKEYPNSFRFEDCVKRKAVTDKISQFINKEGER